jgi:hypothetical protein
VIYACDPSYSGGRDQEDRGLKLARENSCKTLSRKTPHKNRLVEWLKVKAPVLQKKKKKKG